MPYLNVAPLVVGLEGRLKLLPPSQLAVALRQGEIDAGLLSITEALLHDGYDVLDGPCVASFGEVYSVFLAHRGPLESIRTLHCDTASLTSVNLLRVLLAERGLHPEFVPLANPIDAPRLDHVLLIGDPAIRFQLGPPTGHTILDLGAAWKDLTGLPFVYAAWVLRRDADTTELRRDLLAAADRGHRDPESVIRNAAGFDEPFRRRYLTLHVRNRMGPPERAGIDRFVDLLRRHGSTEVHAPRYVR